MERWQYGPDITLGQRRQPGESYFRDDQLTPHPKRRRAETYPFADQSSRMSSKVSCVLCRVILTSSKEISEHLSSKEHYEMMCHHPGTKVEDVLIPESFRVLGDEMSDSRPDYMMGNGPRSKRRSATGSQTHPQKSQLSSTSFQISESELQLARQLSFADAMLPHPSTSGLPSSGKIQSVEAHVGASYPKHHQRAREPFLLQEAGQRTRKPFRLQEAGQRTQEPFPLHEVGQRTRDPFQLQEANQRTREPFQIQKVEDRTRDPFQLKEADQRPRESIQLQEVSRRTREPIQVREAGQRSREPFKLQEAVKKELPQPRESAYSSPHASESKKLRTRKGSGDRGSLKQAAKIKVEPKEAERPKVKVEVVAEETDVKESLIRCKACNIVVPNQFHWEAHVTSERHLENLRKAEEAKAQKQKEEGQVVTEEEMEILERIRAEMEQEEEEMAGWDVPETELSEEREGGEKDVELQPESSQLSSPQVSEGTQPPDFPSIQHFPDDPNMEIHIELRCGLCNMVVQNRDYWEAHTKSPIHQRAMASTSVGDSASTVVGVTGPPMAMFYCSICSTFSYTEKHFTDHVTGRRHRENLKWKSHPKNQNPDQNQNAPPISQQHVTSSTLYSNAQPKPSSQRPQASSRPQVRGTPREGGTSKSAKPVQKQILRKAVETSSASSLSATTLSFSLQRLQKQLSDTPAVKMLSSSQSDPVKVSQPATSTTAMAESPLQETGGKGSTKARGKRCITPILPPEPSATEDTPPEKKRVIRLKRPRSRDSSTGVSHSSSDVEYQRSEEKLNDKGNVPSKSAPPRSSALTSSKDYLRLQKSPPLKALPDSSGTSRMETHASQRYPASKEISPASTSAATSSRPAVTRRVIRIKRSSTVAQSHPQYDSVPSERRVRRSVTPQYPQSTRDQFEEERQRIEADYRNEPEANEEEGYLEFEIHPDTPDFEQYYGQDFTLPLFKRPGDERPRGIASTQPQNQGGGDVEYRNRGNERRDYDFFNTNFRYDINFAHEHPERTGFQTEAPKMHQLGRSFQQTPPSAQTGQRDNWREGQYFSDSFSNPSPEWASRILFHPTSEHHPRFGTPQQPQSKPQPRIDSSEALQSFDSRPTSSNSNTTGRDQLWGSQNPSLMYPSGNRIAADDSGGPRAIHTINYNHGLEERPYPSNYQPLI